MTSYRRKTKVRRAITFDELVDHGIKNGSVLVDGLPWSFTFMGYPISHETNDCYLISTPQMTMRMRRSDVLVIAVDGIWPLNAEQFHRLYEATDEIKVTDQEV